MKKLMKKLSVLLVLCTLLTGAVGYAPAAQAATAPSKKVSITTIKLGKKGKAVTYNYRKWKPAKNMKILLAKITNKTSKKLSKVKYTVTLYSGSKKLVASKWYCTNLKKKTSYILAWQVSSKVTKAKYKVTYAK